MITVPVTVIIPTYKRGPALIDSLMKLSQCVPMPDEILIHFDGNDKESEATLRSSRLTLPVITIINANNVGPGGGRDVLIRKSRNEIIVSLDDDSYPIDINFFDRVIELMKLNHGLSIVGAAITHQGEEILADERQAQLQL